MASDFIPNYGLYGEQSDLDEWNGTHLEEIRDRSSDEGWRIKPHRHGALFQILFLFNGQATVQLDSNSYSVNAAAVVIPRGVVHGFVFEPNSDGVVLTLTEEATQEILNSGERGRMSQLQEQPRVILLGKPQQNFKKTLHQYIQLLRHEFKHPAPIRRDALSSLIRLVCIALCRQIERITATTVANNPKLELLRRFHQRIEQRFRDHQSVADYACDLAVSPSTLNRACQQHYNISAKSMIQNRVISEAKRRLLFTQQPLESIAFSLGFSDPSYFSRIFRKATGQSPGLYRKEQQKGQSLTVNRHSE